MVEDFLQVLHGAFLSQDLFVLGVLKRHAVIEGAQVHHKVLISNHLGNHVFGLEQKVGSDDCVLILDVVADQVSEGKTSVGGEDQVTRIQFNSTDQLVLYIELPELDSDWFAHGHLTNHQGVGS